MSNREKIIDTMRDSNVESSAESPVSDSTYDVDTFYEMKQRLLAERTEMKAIEMFQKLLSHNMEHIDWYVYEITFLHKISWKPFYLKFRGKLSLIFCYIVSFVDREKKHYLLI